MSQHRHPDEVGGGGVGFLILWILMIAYGWFLHTSIGEFKACDQTKYPHQTFCFPEGNDG